MTATFSVPPMDPLIVNATTFTLRQGTNPIAGTISYTGSTASFVPTNNLVLGNTYTATITTGAKSATGVALASDYVWTFNSTTTAGPDAGVNLGTADQFGILAGVGVSNNAGPSQINDLDVGIYPGNRSSITGFFDVDGGPGQINNGAFFAADDIAPPGTNAMLNQAQLDLVAAYDAAVLAAAYFGPLQPC
ncbi:MAG: Ig-like domain-containing protein [Cytophagales bacterium]|nr:Ig-like domain-containing protein [Cytophagales bacterium]